MTKSPLELRWEGLVPDAAKPVFQLVDATHPLDLYLGRDSAGNRLLLLVTGERPSTPKTMKAIRVEVFEREDGRWSFLIRLLNKELGQLFALLCNDLIEASRAVPDPSRPVGLVLKRLALWQRLLERSSSGLLSGAEVRGLVGELSYLSSHMIPGHGAPAAVGAWKGPFRGDQDFQFPDIAHEVKAIRVDALDVTISSEMQLYSESRAIRLVVISLDERTEETHSCKSLNSLVANLKSMLSSDPEAADQFDNCLAAAGYVSQSEYDHPIFEVRQIRIYEVREDFPRICRPQLPQGVAEVCYELSLEACRPFLMPTCML